MAATTTPHISRTAKDIERDFPAVKFRLGDKFYWSSAERTVFYKSIKKQSDLWLLLHEVSHAELAHTTYTSDVELVRYEALAWQRAKELAKNYDLSLDDDFVQDALDTYRMWLHQRSLCPTCSQTGLQQNENTYSCLNCRCSWQVNEARQCDFRRKSLNSSFTAATD